MCSMLDDVAFRCPVCHEPSAVLVRAAAPYLFLSCPACNQLLPLLVFVDVPDARATDGKRRVRVPARSVGM